MRVDNVNGLVTLFYDGSDLWDIILHDEYDYEHGGPSDACLNYWKERESWQQIIIEEGVTVIPKMAFYKCKNIQRVIFANTVIRIEREAFLQCGNLVYVKLSIQLIYIGRYAFSKTNLSSVFIPPRCEHIDHYAFTINKNLLIFHVPPQTRLGHGVIGKTKLIESSPFADRYGGRMQEAHAWIKNLNGSDEYSLHRACCSYQPLQQVIYGIVQERGLGAFKKKNEIGITPSEYMKENPFSDVKEIEVIRYYMKYMIGEMD